MGNFINIGNFMKYGGFIEIPENKDLTFHDLLLACQVSSRSEKGIRLEFEFRHCDLTIVYDKNQCYYGSLIGFNRLAKIKGKNKIVKCCEINFWCNFESYAKERELTVSKCTQSKNSIRADLSNGLRLTFRYSKIHDDFLIAEITSRFGNKRIINATYSETSIIEMESMNFSIINYLIYGGFFNLPGNENSSFSDLLTKCCIKESHSGISGTILGFEFNNWLLEIFYQEDKELIGENLKFLGNQNYTSKNEIIQETEINFWENFVKYAKQNELGIVETCSDDDTIIAFLNTGSNLHFHYQAEYGDYLVTVIEGDGTKLRIPYRSIYHVQT